MAVTVESSQRIIGILRISRVWRVGGNFLASAPGCRGARNCEEVLGNKELLGNFHSQHRWGITWESALLSISGQLLSNCLVIAWGSLANCLANSRPGSSRDFKPQKLLLFGGFKIQLLLNINKNKHETPKTHGHVMARDAIAWRHTGTTCCQKVVC